MYSTNICFLSTGSNLGNRYYNLTQTQQAIAQNIGEVIQASAIYETAAWGLENQATFLNQVLKVETNLNPQDLLLNCQAIETALGRVRREHWGERIIDIDILFFNEDIINQPNLTIPHPYLHQRQFVLVPMKEIAANWKHPVFKQNIDSLLENCEDQLAIKKWKILHVS